MTTTNLGNVLGAVALGVAAVGSGVAIALTSIQKGNVAGVEEKVGQVEQAQKRLAGDVEPRVADALSQAGAAAKSADRVDRDLAALNAKKPATGDDVKALAERIARLEQRATKAEEGEKASQAEAAKVRGELDALKAFAARAAERDGRRGGAAGGGPGPGGGVAPGGAAGGRTIDPGDGKWKPTPEELKRELRLDDEQTRKLTDAIINAQKEFATVLRKNAADGRMLAAHLLDALGGGAKKGLDPARLQKLLETKIEGEEKTLGAAVEAINGAAGEEFKAILTPEQFAELQRGNFDLFGAKTPDNPLQEVLREAAQQSGGGAPPAPGGGGAGGGG
ncbi:MAG: hypothetical protein HY719_05635 [Planctomycetes bacterium]|nr:hypothetical protein [Planctomycetota bacterium]